MTLNAERMFVLTGGPGSGKTTLVEQLDQAGYATSVEAGRSIIRHQTSIGGRALPWCDPIAFAEAVLSWEMRSYHETQNQSGLIFFDRGIPDIAGYLRLNNLPVPTHVQVPHLSVCERLQFLVEHCV